MNTLSFTVNGEGVSTLSEPRTTLADMLREQLNLTGTHLGCEQGVCGACTILVDGVPVRSCISNATACSGSDIRTIEGFDDDAVMVELRAAFNLYHALQCGFCTPGMLVMARDIVTRLADADEERIRIELAGNLCRCTGYAGIVKAIRSVIVARQQRGAEPQPGSARTLGPAGSGHAPERPLEVPSAAPRKTEPAAAATPFARVSGAMKDRKRAPAVRQAVSVDAPPAAVWERFGDVPAMIRCIPGATLAGEEPQGTYQVRMRIKMGPVGAEFAGIATQERDEASRTGVISGEGKDARSASLAVGELTYRISGDEGGPAQIEIEVGYALSGALAQFARGGIVTHFIGAITKQFAANLERSLSGGDDGGNAGELRAAGTFWVALKAWSGELRDRLLRRR